MAKEVQPSFMTETVKTGHERPLTILLAPVNENNVDALKKLNESILPVSYSASFYKKILKTPQAFTKLGTSCVWASEQFSRALTDSLGCFAVQNKHGAAAPARCVMTCSLQRGDDRRRGVRPGGGREGGRGRGEAPLHHDPLRPRALPQPRHR